MITKISCGDMPALFLTSAGILLSIGNNSYGQLGIGENEKIQQSCEALTIQNLLTFKISLIFTGNDASMCYGNLIFNHIFSKLGLDSDEIHEHPLLITEPLLNPKHNREKISEILFEKYGIPALVFGTQPPLSLFSLSSTTGVVLESGEGVSKIFSIVDGYAIPSSFMRSDFGGDVNNYLGQLLKMKGVEFLSDSEKILLHEIKKKHVLCQMEETKVDDVKISTHKLPDSRTIDIDRKEFLIIIYNPKLINIFKN